MYALMIYSLKVGACLAVFYLFFKLLLSRETFHRLNRIVVLAAMVLSFILPFCVITIYRELPAAPEMPAAEQLFEASAEPQPEPFPWDKAAALVFLTGAGATLLWTFGSVFGVIRMIRRGRRERLADGTVLVRIGRSVTPFSWYRYIVLSENDLAEKGDAIVLHEKAHRVCVIRSICCSPISRAASSGSTPRCGCFAANCGPFTNTKPTRPSSTAASMRNIINYY